MNKYKLTPIAENLQDNDWQTSTYKGVIEVCAEDKYDAQLICFEATGIAALVKPGNKIPYNPWQQEKLVHCELIEQNCRNERGIVSPKNLRDEWQSRNHS